MEGYGAADCQVAGAQDLALSFGVERGFGPSSLPISFVAQIDQGRALRAGRSSTIGVDSCRSEMLAAIERDQKGNQQRGDNVPSLEQSSPLFMRLWTHLRGGLNQLLKLRPSTRV